MKVAVYTCVTNAYDQIYAPKVSTNGVDYLCFTDGSITPPPPWHSVLIDIPYREKDTNRYIKILPHKVTELKPYDLTIYIDGSIKIVGDLSILIQKISDSSHHVFMYDHPYRNCVYQEAKAVITSIKSPVFRTLNQMHTYRNQGMPEKYGLFEAGIIARKHASESIELMEAWWLNYINSKIKRDQIILMYTLWKNDANIESLGKPDHRFENIFFSCNQWHAKDGFLYRKITSKTLSKILSAFFKFQLLRI